MHDKRPADLPCACTALRKAARAVTRAYDDAIAPVGMTTAQLAVLRAIGRAADDGAPLSRLAETLVMDTTTLYRALTPLQRAGWVQVTKAAKGRGKLARLTPAGQGITIAAAPHWEGAQSTFIRAFGVERWAALHSEIAALAATGVRVKDERTQ